MKGEIGYWKLENGMEIGKWKVVKISQFLISIFYTNFHFPTTIFQFHFYLILISCFFQFFLL